MDSQSPSATGVKCRHCGQALEEGTPFCPACGRAGDVMEMGNGEQKDIYLLLVTANVLRLRRQWPLAEAKCSEVLGRDPDSAGAYSLLGDISRDQGKLRDAIEWYKMALDRNPGSAVDRQKLEAVIDRVFAMREKGVVASAREKLSGGLGRAAAEAREARLAPSGVVIVAAVLGAILLIAAAVMLVGRPREPAAEARSESPASGAFVVASPGEAPAQPAAERAAEGSRALARFADEVALLEGGLEEELVVRARAIDPNCQVVSVEIDPTEARVMVRLLMPRVWVASATRAGIERVAVPLAGEAASWHELISEVRVRCDVHSEEGGRQLALRAEGSAREVAKAKERLDARVEELFSFVWWHPELRE